MFGARYRFAGAVFAFICASSISSLANADLSRCDLRIGGGKLAGRGGEFGVGVALELGQFHLQELRVGLQA